MVDKVYVIRSEGPRKRAGVQELLSGWRLIAAALAGILFGVTALFFYSTGLFLKPVSQEFGLPRGVTSLVNPVASLGLALTAPLIGALVDRLGIRVVALASGVGLSVGFVALSFSPVSFPAYLALIGLCVLLGSGASPVVYTRLINENFDRARGTALGLSQTATGIAGAIVPLLLVPFIAAHGWRAGYQALGAVVLISTPIVLLLIGPSRGPVRARGERATAESGMRVGEVLRDSLFHRLVLVICLAAIAVGGLIVHLVPMLTDAGLSPAAAGRAAASLGVGVIAARIITGLLVDRVFAPFVATGVFAIAAAGCLLLALGGSSFAGWAASFVGLAMGAEVDLISYFVARYFGLRDYGKVYGWLYAAFMVGTSIGPVIAGVAFDHYGNYRLGLLVLGSCALAAGAVAATLGPFRDFGGGSAMPGEPQALSQPLNGARG